MLSSQLRWLAIASPFSERVEPQAVLNVVAKLPVTSNPSTVASILRNSAGRARSRCLALGAIYLEAFKLSCYVSLVVLIY